ncbi:hypothetical protein [Candidatus Poriferisodalis sp.]|uniref:hypothetical protein n=1 Tax=Candidatus Poriferisodalis sp. TaxID=3101277 RepID=UPI003B0120AB
MTNRFVAVVAFAALVLSALSLFVALGAADDETPAVSQALPQTSVPPDADDGSDAGAAAESAATAEAPPTPSTVPPVTAAPAAPTSEASQPTASTVPDDALPGTPAALGPAEGTRLGVIGVTHDDWLNLREVPNGTIVATLSIRIGNSAAEGPSLLVQGPDGVGHLATLDIVGLIATGRTRDLATSTWHEIQAGPVTGWASRNYLAPFASGQRHDVTTEVLRGIGDAAQAATLHELATSVVEQFASATDPVSRVRNVAPPSAFEGVVEVAFDVVGLPDDSARGYRLYIDAEPAGDWMAAGIDGDLATDAGPYTLRQVSATTLCYSHRGVSDDGRCN